MRDKLLNNATMDLYGHLRALSFNSFLENSKILAIDKKDSDI